MLPVPMNVPSLLNVTVPVVVPVALVVTVAVNVSEFPYVDEGDEDSTLVVVVALLMAWE
jgi:hypothetical protein